MYMRVHDIVLNKLCSMPNAPRTVFEKQAYVSSTWSFWYLGLEGWASEHSVKMG